MKAFFTILLLCTLHSNTADHINKQLRACLDIIAHEQSVKQLQQGWAAQTLEWITSWCIQKDPIEVKIHYLQHAIHLIEQGADPNTSSNNGNLRLLHLMSAAGNIRIIQMLLERNADPRLCDSRGWNAYDYARLDYGRPPSTDPDNQKAVIALLATSKVAAPQGRFCKCKDYCKATLK